MTVFLYRKQRIYQTDHMFYSIFMLLIGMDGDIKQNNEYGCILFVFTFCVFNDNDVLFQRKDQKEENARESEA